MVFALGNKVHGTIDGLLLVLRDCLQIVKISLKNSMEILEDEDIRVDVDDIIKLSALCDQLLQEGVSGGPVIQVIVCVPAFTYTSHRSSKQRIS